MDQDAQRSGDAQEARVRRSSVLFGRDATPAEITAASGVGAMAAVAVPLAAAHGGAQWNALLFVLAAVIAFDIVGGVVANGLNSAKRAHFEPLPAGRSSVGERLARRPIVFAALHLHPLVVGMLYPPHLWWWGLLWYLWVLASVVLVRTVPQYLQRPAALGAAATTVLIASAMPAPPFWAWLPVMLVLKLALAHAVQEKAYRAAGSPPGSGG